MYNKTCQILVIWIEMLHIEEKKSIKLELIKGRKIGHGNLLRYDPSNHE